MREFLSAAICAAAPAMCPIVAAALDAAQSLREAPRMLDLGTSFLASVERDPDALAIVDGAVRLTYRAMVPAHFVASLPASTCSGCKPGDHLVTVLQNRWQAATIHWACQFAGIIITPVNWRATRERARFLPARTPKRRRSSTRTCRPKPCRARARREARRASASATAAVGELDFER